MSTVEIAQLSEPAHKVLPICGYPTFRLLGAHTEMGAAANSGHRSLPVERRNARRPRCNFL